MSLNMPFCIVVFFCLSVCLSVVCLFVCSFVCLFVCSCVGSFVSLKALAVDDAWSSFIVLLLGDPHFLESGERSKDGSANPDRVLPLGGSDDLNLHGRRGQGSNLLLHAVGDTGVHGGATGKDGVGVQVLAKVDV